MNKTTKDEIRKNIRELEALQNTPAYREAEDLLLGILIPMLGEDGYQVQQTVPGRDSGVDFLAQRRESSAFQGATLAIEYKHRARRPVGMDAIRQVLGAAVIGGFDRAMVVCNTRFSAAARATAERELPLRVELIDLDALKAWWARIEIDASIDTQQIVEILKTVSWRLAKLIAENPENLRLLEWRKLEELMAEVLEGIGFEVELTPGSKDGGKDLVLRCNLAGAEHSYVVEVKHWRSMQRVGQSAAKDFLKVVVAESRDGGLFLSTYGFCNNAFEALSEIERTRLRFGDREKIVSLCRTYLKAESGIWSPPELLPTVLFEETF